MDNKDIFAKNLKIYVDKSGKSRKEICNALGLNYYTFADWINGRKYPRMDKVEKLADYFGILKSDLIEEKEEMNNKVDAIGDIVPRLRTDEVFLEVVKELNEMDNKRLQAYAQMLSLLKKSQDDGE